MKKISLFVTISLLAAINFTAAADTGDSYDPLKTQMSDGQLLEYVVEDGQVQRTSYIAIDPPTTTDGSLRVWKWCATLKDVTCDPSGNPANLEAMSVLGPCSSPTEENCIDSLYIGNSATNLVKAELIKVVGGLTFPASPEYDFPGGTNISLWNVPGVTSAGGGTTFAVTSREHLRLFNGKFQVTDFFTGVNAYRLQKGDYAVQSINTSSNATPENLYSDPKIRNGFSCVWVDTGECGVNQDFTPNTRIKVIVRISKRVGGWFQGRLNDPVLDVNSFSNNYNLLSVEGGAVTVPRMALAKAWDKFSTTEKNWFPNFGQWPATYGQATGPQAGIPEMAFPFINLLRNEVNDSASGSNTYWNFITTASGQGSNCLRDTSKILGVVSTNAMAYDGNSPSFESGTLNYRVSGLHFMPDGKTPVLGTYNLVMRSDTARCLYNFTNAPIKATVSISGEGGTTIATTAMNERNGWLSLFAAGFTFSEKNIQVKFVQDAPEPAAVTNPTLPQTNSEGTQTLQSPTVIPNKSPVKIIAKKFTITCVKGKVSKKITAINPKCPTGYTKK